jgi:predicted dehydrogenase
VIILPDLLLKPTKLLFGTDINPMKQETEIPHSISRRTFLGHAATASALGVIPYTSSAASYKRSIGANDRIRIGQIGCGSRGFGVHQRYVKQHAEAENLEVVAVCDPYKPAQEKVAAHVKEWSGRAPKQFTSFRDMLEMKDLDAVMIASPDHVHTLHLEAVAKTGKHCYAEKPLGIELDALKRAVDAAEEAKIIVQIGTQHRTEASNVGCQKLLESGILGHISRVEQVRNAAQPYWYKRLDPTIRKEDLDWDEFTNGRTDKPFDPLLYTGWYGYYEFSQGPVAQLGSHYIDLIHYLTGLHIPETCNCHGGTYTWKDDYRFTAPDQIDAIWSYPEDTVVTYTTNFGNSSGNRTRIMGEKGTLELERRGIAIYTAEGGINRDGSIRGKNEVEDIQRPDHFLNWFQALRGKVEPHAPLEAGYRHAVATIMAQMSYESGRRSRYHADSRKITLD